MKLQSIASQQGPAAFADGAWMVIILKYPVLVLIQMFSPCVVTPIVSNRLALAAGIRNRGSIRSPTVMKQ